MAGSEPRLRLRAWLRLLGSTVCGLMPGSRGWSSVRGLPGVWLGGRALPVGEAVSPSALAVRRSFIRHYWPVHTDKLWGVGPFAGRARWGGPGILALPVGGFPGVHISYLRHESLASLGGYLHFAPMGHWLWFGTAKQRNVPIRALLRFGNVKLKNVKVASVVVGAVLGRALLVGVALFFVTEKLESPPPTPARMGMVLCCLLVYSGDTSVADW